VHEDIVRPQPLSDRTDRPLIGQIDREFARPVENRDLVFGFGQRSDDRAPDPARSSGDDRCSPHRVRRDAKAAATITPDATWSGQSSVRRAGA
jgi:hypothetical protein